MEHGGEHDKVKKNKQIKVDTPSAMLALKGKTLRGANGKLRTITRFAGVDHNPHWYEEGLVFWCGPNGKERDKGVRVCNFCATFLKKAEVINE